MTTLEIARLRIQNQHIAKQTFKQPEEVVSYMGAVKSALGFRLQNSSDGKIDKALAKGAIIRTHVLRPTWHFVTPADVRWMLELTAPRINAFCASMFRKLQLDNAVFKKSNDTLAKALEGGKQLDRAEVMT